MIWETITPVSTQHLLQRQKFLCQPATLCLLLFVMVSYTAICIDLYFVGASFPVIAAWILMPPVLIVCFVFELKNDVLPQEPYRVREIIRYCVLSHIPEFPLRPPIRG